MGRDREQRLAIMGDKSHRTFGRGRPDPLFMLEIVALADLPSAPRVAGAAAAPVIARAVPPMLARLFGAAAQRGPGRAAFVAGVGAGGAALAWSWP